MPIARLALTDTNQNQFSRAEETKNNSCCRKRDCVAENCARKIDKCKKEKPPESKADCETKDREKRGLISHRSHR